MDTTTVHINNLFDIDILYEAFGQLQSEAVEVSVIIALLFVNKFYRI